jgi:ketosteroid isomerase-like protein
VSQENVEIVRQAFESFVAGAIIWETMDEEIEIHDHDILDAGQYRGHSGFTRWVADWEAGLPVIGMELQELIDAGDAVVAVFLLKAKPRGGSVDVERQDGIVYTLRSGKICRLDYYNSKQQALEGVGLGK